MISLPLDFLNYLRSENERFLAAFLRVSFVSDFKKYYSKYLTV